LAIYIKVWQEASPQTEFHHAMFIDLQHRFEDGQYRPLGKHAIRHVITVACEAAGLPPTSPHDLRRTFARLAQENGAPFELIRQSLGHAHIETTERYINSRQQFKMTATDLLDQWLQG
jgi:integrase/recombinase XerD